MATSKSTPQSIDEQILDAAEHILRSRLECVGKIGEPSKAERYLRAHSARGIFGCIYLDTHTNTPLLGTVSGSRVSSHRRPLARWAEAEGPETGGARMTKHVAHESEKRKRLT